MLFVITKRDKLKTRKIKKTSSPLQIQRGYVPLLLTTAATFTAVHYDGRAPVFVEQGVEVRLINGYG